MTALDKHIAALDAELKEHYDTKRRGYGASFAPEGLAARLNESRILGTARREAQPSFKPEGEPDELRDRWEVMRGAMHPSGATLRIESPGLLSIHTHVTPDQARRILAMLSEEGEVAE